MKALQIVAVCALLVGCSPRVVTNEVVRHDTTTVRDTAYIVREVQVESQREDSAWQTEVVTITVYDTVGRVVQVTDIAKQSGHKEQNQSQSIATETQEVSHTEAAGHNEQGKIIEKVKSPIPWWCWAALVACPCLIFFDMWLAVKAWKGK